MHKIYNYLNKIVPNVSDKNKFIENYKKNFDSISPVIPHLANECLEEIGMNSELSWPKIKREYLSIKSLNIVVQINGKKKDLLNIDKSLQEDEILKLISNNEKLNKFLVNKEIKENYLC